MLPMPTCIEKHLDYEIETSLCESQLGTPAQTCIEKHLDYEIETQQVIYRETLIVVSLHCKASRLRD